MAISTAIASDRVSRVVGYKIRKANFQKSTPYLPMRVAILGEANDANQASIDITPFEFTTLKEVGDKYGYGSPLYSMARIIRGQNNTNIQGIPTVIYPQLSDVAATATTIIKSITGTATANTTHYLRINGRTSLDGASYGYSVAIGDEAADLIPKIVSTVANVIGSPVIATLDAGNLKLVTKWKGVTSAELEVAFDTGNNAAGLVYAEVSKTNGTGVVDLTDSLALFGSNWNTFVVNQYGTSQLSELEAFNGVPDPENPTGRFIGNDFKPFISFFGSKLATKADVIAITDASARKSQVTNVFCPAPNSEGYSWEAAVNMLISYCSIAQNMPHLGNGGRVYIDMPTPINGNIGDFGDYDSRDYMAVRGASTVTLESDNYVVQDMFTTYHPDGENPPKFRKVRDLIVDWNIAFGWLLIEKRDILDKVITSDIDIVTVDNVISQKAAKQLLKDFITEKVAEAFIVDRDFSVNSIEVGINSQNPTRLDLHFLYKRSSTADIVSTDAAVDFAFSL